MRATRSPQESRHLAGLPTGPHSVLVSSYSSSVGEAMKRHSRAGGEPIKGRPHKAPEPKRRNAPKTVAPSNLSIAGKKTEVARLTLERNEALEQLKAAS